MGTADIIYKYEVTLKIYKGEHTVV